MLEIFVAERSQEQKTPGVTIPCRPEFCTQLLLALECFLVSVHHSIVVVLETMEPGVSDYLTCQSAVTLISLLYRMYALRPGLERLLGTFMGGQLVEAEI